MLLWMFYICEHDGQQNVVNSLRQEVRIEARGTSSVTRWLRLEMQMFSPREMVVPNRKLEPVMSQRLWGKEEYGGRQPGAGGLRMWLGPS